MRPPNSTPGARAPRAVAAMPALLLPTSGNHLSVRVHPVPLFAICDAYIRRNEKQDRVIGTLLGVVVDNVVEVKNCFVVPHNESSEQAGPPPPIRSRAQGCRSPLGVPAWAQPSGDGRGEVRIAAITPNTALEGPLPVPGDVKRHRRLIRCEPPPCSAGHARHRAPQDDVRPAAARGPGGGHRGLVGAGAGPVGSGPIWLQICTHGMHEHGCDRSAPPAGPRPMWRAHGLTRRTSGCGTVASARGARMVPALTPRVVTSACGAGLRPGRLCTTATP